MYAPIIEALTDVNGHQRHRIKNKLQTNSIKKKKRKKQHSLGSCATLSPPFNACLAVWLRVLFK